MAAAVFTVGQRGFPRDPVKKLPASVAYVPLEEAWFGHRFQGEREKRYIHLIVHDPVGKAVKVRHGMKLAVPSSGCVSS